MAGYDFVHRLGKKPAPEPPPRWTRVLRGVVAPLRWINRVLHAISDWINDWHVTRIMAAITSFAVIIAVFSFLVDMQDRVDERTARAWQLVLTKAPGNSGKKTALEYLNSEDGIPFLSVKTKENLEGIDLSKNSHGGPVKLDGIDLRGAFLGGANLRGTFLGGADLSGAYLSKADLSATDLSKADLREVILLTQPQLAQACSHPDSKPLLPPGFHPPPPCTWCLR